MIVTIMVKIIKKKKENIILILIFNPIYLHEIETISNVYFHFYNPFSFLLYSILTKYI
jgi:hypothetical protein